MSKCKGKDQWGYYYDMTGYEARGFCFWCGKPVKNKRFCNDNCQNTYHNHFVWEYARNWCLARAGYKCEKCAIKPLKHPHRKNVIASEIDELIAEYPLMSLERAYRRIEQEYQNDYKYEYKKYQHSQLEAHHIIPLKGDKRHINILNRPENLICLCNECHIHIKTDDKPREIMQLELF